jgi:L-2,4-diaminobutyrate decarboxylase
MGAVFANLIEKESNFEVALKPMSNIVCFRYLEPGMSTEYLNELNVKIRQALLEDGEFYIVQTKLKGVHYMRITVMNPFTNLQHFKALIEKIKLIKSTI